MPLECDLTKVSGEKGHNSRGYQGPPSECA